MIDHHLGSITATVTSVLLGAACIAAVPRPRIARTLPGSRIAAVVTNAPLGAKIAVPERGARPWSTSGWRAGDVVTYSNAVYVCVQCHVAQINWCPPAVPALWRLVRAATDTPGQPPAWRQPLGAHDAYAKGARVTHGGFTWQSTTANNVWAPGVYGWVKE